MLPSIATLSPYECPANYHGLKSYLAGKFPELALRFWHKKIGDSDVYLAAGTRDSLPSFMVMECKELHVEANEAEFFPLFEECLAAFPDLLERGVQFCSSVVMSPNAFKSFLDQQEGNWKRKPNPCSCFLMTAKQQEKVMELSISLPEGYRFDAPDIEKDGQIITDTWIHSGPNEIAQTIMKLKYHPSALVRQGDDAVGFEMANFFGAQNHLYVLEGHRQKGLGRAVELKMSQECIKAGMVPFKFIEHWNANVLERAKKDTMWTEKVDSNGNPMIYQFTHFSRQ
uniref:Glycine N-acyltransferase-like protein n=1 Tax=Steinernema glaseri TaxID=37863 RepID=A0A1I7YSJ6_9BILA